MGQKIYKKINVDQTKIKKLLKETGDSTANISVEMGYGKSALSNRIRLGYINVTDAKYLELVYGIKREQYEVPEDVEDDPSDEEKELTAKISQSQIEKSIANALGEYQPIDYERLYKVIYSAAYEAVRKAWSE